MLRCHSMRLLQGKSTLIGTLSKGELDDGRGSARKLIFRHAHEQETGRTSAIASQYLGFDEGGQQVLTKKLGRLAPWQELAKSSTRTLQLIDLAGHEKYLKTTIFGLTGMMPDLGVVIVGANMGVKRMTKEHFGVSSALEIPVVVAVTKIDLVRTKDTAVSRSDCWTFAVDLAGSVRRTS